MKSKFKKTVSAVSACAIIVSAFSAYSLTASAAVSSYAEDFSSGNTGTIIQPSDQSTYGSKVTIDTLDGNALKIANSTAGNGRDAATNWYMTDSVEHEKTTISFDVVLCPGNNASGSAGREAASTLYVLPAGSQQTPSDNKAPSEYLFGIRAHIKSLATDKNSLDYKDVSIVSGSDPITIFYSNDGSNDGIYDKTRPYEIEMSRSVGATNTSAIHVQADIDFSTDTASIKINGIDAGTVDLYTKDKNGVAGLGYQGGGKTYGFATFDNVSVTKTKATTANGTSSVIDYKYIDYAFGNTGDWSYNSGISFAQNMSAVHFNGLAAKDAEGYGPATITVPIKSLPDNAREIKFYSNVPQSYNMAQGLSSYNVIAVSDNNVKSFDPTLIDDATKGIGLSSKTPFATLKFTTDNNKRYVTINGDAATKTEVTNDSEVVIDAPDISSDVSATLPPGVSGTAETFDILVYVDGLKDSKLAAGSLGELTLNYEGPVSKDFTLKAATAVNKIVAQTPANGDKYYFGQLNAKDLTNIAVTTKAKAANEMKVNFYALPQQVADLKSATFADANKIGTATIAKDATTGTATISSKALADNMYIYAVVSALDKEGKGVTAAEIDNVTFGYKSIDLDQNEVQTQYYLQNTLINNANVMPDNTFNNQYYSDFTSLLTTIESGYNSASAEFKSRFLAEYSYLTESKKGWDVVKSISDNISSIYSAVNKAEDKYVEANKSRSTIFEVQEEYDALSTATAQKFVGQFNYSQLKELNDIIINGDAEIVDTYKRAIDIVWDTTNDSSRITQENYLVNSKSIETLRERYSELNTYPDEIKNVINQYNVEEILAEVDEAVATFIPVTANEFKEKFAVVKEAYDKAETYDAKYAAVYGLNDLSDLYDEIKSSEYSDRVAEQTEGNYDTYAGYIKVLSADVLANAYLEKVDALRNAISESQGVSVEKYEIFAAQYNDAIKAKDAYVANGEPAITEETRNAVAEADTYMAAAQDLINATAEQVVATAKTAIDAIGTVENNTISMTSVKLADYHFAALGTNAKLYLSSMANGDSTYGEVLAAADKAMSEFVAANEKAIQALYDEYNSECVNYTASLNYKSDAETYNDAKSAYNTNYKVAAEDLDKINRVAKGTVRYDDKEKQYVVDNAAASSVYTSIENTYKNLDNYTKAIDTLRSTGEAYATSIQNAIDFYYDGESYTYENFTGDNAITEAQIADHIADLYDTTIDYYLDDLVEKNEKGEVTSDGNTEAAKNTNNIRTAVTTAASNFTKAVDSYASYYTSLTDASASDLDLAESEEIISISQIQIDVYAKIEKAVAAKLSSEYDKDMAIENAKAEKEDAARAEVDELVSLIDELYTKVSTNIYESDADIEADRNTYSTLTARAIAGVGNVKYVYSDDIETIDYFVQLYPAEADSKLAYVDTTLTQWSNAWVVVAEANALDIRPVKSDEGIWTVNDATKFNEIKAEYNALTAAEKTNVDTVVSVSFADRDAYIALLNGINGDYANRISGLNDIVSKSSYAAAKDTLSDVNAYVKALNDTIADDKASETDKAAAQAKLDEIALNYGEETDRLTVLNNQATIVKPAYDFDTLVDEANDLDATPDTPAENVIKKLNEAEKVYEEMSADSKKYVTNYALYESLADKYNSGAVQGFVTAVSALSAGKYTEPNESFKTTYDELIADYNDMSDAQKAKVSSQYATLEALKVQNDNIVAARAEAKTIDNENLAIMTTYTDITSENYDAAKAAYDAQKAKMEALDAKYPEYSGEKASASIINTMDQLSADLDSFKAIMDVIDLINAIGSVDETSGDKIAAARTAYDKLAPANKMAVSNYAMLVEAENTYNSFDSIKNAKAQAEVVIGLIDAIDTAAVEDKNEAIKAARTAYDALSDLAKSFVTNYKDLTDIEATLINGDVDGDGSVTASDMVMIVQNILGNIELNEAQTKKADLNNDGSINVLDLLELITIW